MRPTRILAIAGLAAGGLLVAGAGSALAVPSELTATERVTAKRTVSLKEWSVTPNRNRVKRGKVKFVVRNVGTELHNFVVIRTRKGAANLPLTRNGLKAKEKGRVGKIRSFRPGQKRTIRLKLPKGSYALICNIPGHYESGMFIDLKVK
ncbi:MAG: sulfocyanin-like copper-binding protein [Gaiellales bacterium]